MEFLFLIALAVVCFALFLIGYKFFKMDAIYILAIGGAVSSNIYHIGSYPIAIGSFTFGLDSVIYTLFVFCIMFVAVKYSRKEAMKLTLISASSILFTAIIQFLASWATQGVVKGVVWGLVSFVVSAGSTLLAVWLVLMLAEKLKPKVGGAVIIMLGVLIVSIINSFLYYGAVFIFDGGVSNFWMILASSYIGKFMTLGLGLGAYGIISAIERKELKSKQVDIFNNEK